ncbi:amidase [Breoghania sp. JC706]|uniref:amidase n=1 Tax=Breoghania sp. JC706 TaxID=3117732 RepID=UPI00300B2A3F
MTAVNASPADTPADTPANTPAGSLSWQVSALEGGAETPLTLAERALERAEARRDLNAFVALDRAVVMVQAEAADARRKAGRPLGPLDGVPIAVKDNYLTRDYPTTACSNALPLEPAGEDARIVANLRAGGAVIFGKTNMHEWAYGATNTASSIGPTRNPRDTTRITGGSSGGSAAAVAAGIVAAALGSDTGGSVRIPAAACGVCGFKPSYGRASRRGVLPLSWSLDAPGPIAGTLADLAHLLPFFLGPDAGDRTTFAARPYAMPAPDVAGGAVPRLLSLEGADLERSDEVGAALSRALSNSGAACETVDLPDAGGYFAAWEAILHCEASAYHAPLLAACPEGFSPVTRAHLEAGMRLSGPEYLEAQAIRARFVDLLLNGLGAWDALVLPTLPVVAPRLGEDWQEFGGRRVATQDAMTWFCWLGNLAGLPCVTLPVANAGTGDAPGLPVGLMLMGRPGADEALLALAGGLEGRMREARDGRE